MPFSSGFHCECSQEEGGRREKDDLTLTCCPPDSYHATPARDNLIRGELQGAIDGGIIPFIAVEEKECDYLRSH